MTPYTGTEQQNLLLDLLVQCCYEDNAFMENRMIELIKLKQEELVETYLSDDD